MILKVCIIDNSTWYVMSHAPALKFHEIGEQYGFRTWVEYGLKQSKDELGWADFRMTSYEQIQKWWEMVMSAFLMVSLFAEPISSTIVALCPISFLSSLPGSTIKRGREIRSSVC